MNDNQDIEILEALVELKNQIQDLRRVLADSIDEESTSEEVTPLNDASTIDDYRMELSPQEMNALLFPTPADRLPQQGSVNESDCREETVQLRKEFTNFNEQTSREINDLKQSVVLLSEMFGRHELEIKKANRF